MYLKFFPLAALLVLLSVCQYSTQQLWRNDKLVRQWQTLGADSGFQAAPQAPPQYAAQAPPQDSYQPPAQNNQQPPSQGSGLGQFIGSFMNNNNNNNNNDYVVSAPSNQNGYPSVAVVENVQASPVNVQPVVISHNLPPIVNLPPVAVGVQLPVGPFTFQKPTITNTGETIIENLIGGIPFDCAGRSGHFRDSRFCDIFHACVWGIQRKTYACPFVGERTYYDAISRK